jgi:hypothetical protein
MVARTAVASVLAAALAVLSGCGSAATDTHVAALHIRTLTLPRPYASDRAVDTGRVVTARDQESVLASDGFNPTTDGFSFENYGFIAGPQLDQHDLREMFGDGVCAGPPSDTCTLTPAAQQFVQQVDDAMLGGHCFGFAVTAWRFFNHDLSQPDFGGTTTFSLSPSAALISEIAYGWAMQTLPSVQRATVAETPAQEIQFLTKALADPSAELYTIGIYNAQGGGHAVSPIAVENLGGGQYDILIYDNNFPGVLRAISVDTTADTWSYNGAPNPSVPPELYSGQGATNEMQLIPLSPGLGVQPCTICTSSGPPAQGMVQVSLAGNPVRHGHLLITASGGRKLGYQAGRVVNQIEGARVYRPLLDADFLAAPEPIYQLPADVGAIQITLEGDGATGHDPATVHVTGPGFGATVTHLLPQTGSVDRLELTAARNQLSFASSGTGSGEAPVVQYGLSHGHGGSELTLAPRSLSTGATVTVKLEPSANHATVSASAGATNAPAALKVSSIGSNGTRTATVSSLSLATGRPATVPLPAG